MAFKQKTDWCLWGLILSGGLKVERMLTGVTLTQALIQSVMRSKEQWDHLRDVEFVIRITWKKDREIRAGNTG